MKYYTVRYSGGFGFIKPWTAVRDSKTFSQQFLTPSVVEGIEKKLFPELLPHKGIRKIVRYKLCYAGISVQQEVTQPRGWEYKKTQKLMVRNRSILERGVLVDPVLVLAFAQQEDAQRAHVQHICLCRNEDILLPDSEIHEMDQNQFDEMNGFELHFGEDEQSFMVGFNRYNELKPMYGTIKISGKPVSGN